MGNESDEAAMHRASHGDARAFGVVWDRHHARVFRHLISTGTDAHDAEDLVATAYLELWRRRSHIRYVDGSVLPWLLVTARNVARNAERARRRYRAFLAALPPPASIPDHADAVAERDDPALTELRKQLRSARPADARLLALTVVEGFTVKEASIALGISESAAKMRLSRLRARLAGALSTPFVAEENT